ncbi:hypothetical protein QEZ47_03995 [Aminobacter anthyllidis]|uniref:LpqB family beta-propeller domain-containing protein n=1 Tax=Hyphomicrobiales TaxID=356 RepID=UPI002454F946|nr:MULTISPECIES: hypothetical protein [Hyphomicrobiales]MDH4983962.1 hypothetical protein [Hyphomicrobium sp. D-2]MDH4984726.1 hypothetical protein [Aminobacter anthyllidis]
MNIAVPNADRIIDDSRARLDIVVAQEAELAMARLGRTEDVKFSPDGRRIAIAGFAKGTCLLLDVEIERSGSRPILHVTDYMELHSAALNEPHGFDFIDDRTLLVANRMGGVAILAVPVSQQSAAHPRSHTATNHHTGRSCNASPFPWLGMRFQHKERPMRTSRLQQLQAPDYPACDPR